MGKEMTRSTRGALEAGRRLGIAQLDAAGVLRMKKSVMTIDGHP